MSACVKCGSEISYNAENRCSVCRYSLVEDLSEKHRQSQRESETTNKLLSEIAGRLETIEKLLEKIPTQ